MRKSQNIDGKHLGHVMLDLETMGNKSNKAIISVGAVEFDLNSGETGDEFYSRVDLQSCLDIGLNVDASTIYWWLTQNEKARQEVAKGGELITNVLKEFTNWYDKLGDNVEIWGNGVRFDVGLLEDAYVACGWHKMPWNFRKERDLRTLVSFAPQIKSEVLDNFKGVKHDPIDDCKAQIEYASKIWNRFFKSLNENPKGYGTK